MRASLVIASHNEGELLHKTVQSCIETIEDLDCEIVVADDASHDGSIEEFQRRFDSVRVVTHPERLGVSATKDLGARHARGDVLVFLDGHCKPERGAIAGLIEAVEDWDGEAVVTPSVAALDVARWECAANHFGHGYSVNLASCKVRWIGLDGMQALSGPSGRLYYKQPTMIGCTAAMGRNLYERLLGFDVGMRFYGSEDVDFGVKCWLMGYPVLHDPEPVIGHRFQANFKNYTVSAPHVEANKFRMARKSLGDEAWSAWIGRFDSERDSPWWQEIWAAFMEGKPSLEREREYLLAHRRNDEFWYAAEFGMDWPRSDTLWKAPPLIFAEGETQLPSSPLPSPPTDPSPSSSP